MVRGNRPVRGLFNCTQHGFLQTRETLPLILITSQFFSAKETELNDIKTSRKLWNKYGFSATFLSLSLLVNLGEKESRRFLACIKKN